MLLYTSLVRPLLTYAGPVWGTANKTQMHRLQVIQNKFLRTATNAPWFLRTQQLHQELGIIPLEQYIHSMSKSFFNKLPGVPEAVTYNIGARSCQPSTVTSPGSEQGGSYKYFDSKPYLLALMDSVGEYNRICMPQIKSDVINAHAPTEEKDDHIKDSFYEKLEHTFDQLPRYHMKVLLGDFNAEVGRKDIFKPTIDAELHALYTSPDIIRNIKSRRLRWAGHVARMGESRNAYRVIRVNKYLGFYKYSSLYYLSRWLEAECALSAFRTIVALLCFIWVLDAIEVLPRVRELVRKLIQFAKMKIEQWKRRQTIPGCPARCQLNSQRRSNERYSGNADMSFSGDEEEDMG
ncbi:hypothetical protein ANN_05139 [Periplaneta americana]|uniref:Uncharacterized protein n=1 Tax=Periplaneta americana TaxID=6978 RepID=A0ABQ8TC51_PERAM|nr:hypothetical protein ANN_05139 [Periplaneta americana]